MGGEKDDRFAIAVLDQLSLQLKSAHPRHAHIDDEATRPVRELSLKQVLSGGETNRIEAD